MSPPRRSPPASRALRLRVAAELPAHRREELLAEGARLARAEARVERRGQHRRRHRLRDRRVHGPAPLAGVVHRPGEALEARVRGERRRGEVEQPGGDDAAAPPQLRDLGEIQVVPELLPDALAARPAQEVEALGVGLHEPVLDAVVDHLHEVARAVRAAVEIAVLSAAGAGAARRRWRGGAARGERPEHGLEPLEGVAIAAHHEAVAALETEDAAARPGVEVADPLLGEEPGAADVVLEEGVPAVDDDVPGRQPLAERERRLLGRRAGGHHHPHRARSRELPDEVVERRGDAPARTLEDPGRASIVASSFANGSAKSRTPSSSSRVVTSSSETPSAASSAMAARAPSRPVSRVGATRPWSRKASKVAGGTVSTVSGPISSSMYMTSR